VKDGLVFSSVHTRIRYINKDKIRIERKRLTCLREKEWSDLSKALCLAWVLIPCSLQSDFIPPGPVPHPVLNAGTNLVIHENNQYFSPNQG
jgi:hypothetical protein